jgi:S-adenosylmethionine-diacylglycerol 3-amino-3-carboxypropyl transferase
LRHLPDHEAFLRFFGGADSGANVQAYDAVLRQRLDPVSRAYWDARGLARRRRIELFARNFYRYGLLGRCLGAGHALARLHGLDPSAILQADSPAHQRVLFDRHLAPIFDKPAVRWLMRQPASLYGLGIPPAQYRALSKDSPDGIGMVLRRRLERLACDFDIHSNYFAWQAFGRRYARGPNAALPPYLQRGNFETLRARSDRLGFVQRSFTETLGDSAAASFDCYVLLDAQDWMNDADLTALWTQITRTARPGARVIFRTAADERLLPGRVPADLLDAWEFEADRSRELGRRDRSSIYGAFHLYRLVGRG